MPADVAGTIAVALALDEPEMLLGYLKQQAMVRMDTIAPLDAYLAKKWAQVAESLAECETALEKIKRAPA